MQRYFIAADQFYIDHVTLTGDDARHLHKVMRARVGDQFIACDGMEREVVAEVSDIGDGIITATIVEQRSMLNEPKVQVWIAQSLPKGDKLEAVIQKCTEIGAARFIPFESARTIVQYDSKKEAKRVERWNKIAKEAAEQAHRNRIPEVCSPLSWKSLLQVIPDVSHAWICYEKPEGQGLKEALQELVNTAGYIPGPLLLIIGPEGGFEPDEVAQVEVAGGHCVSLGRRILRTETAAMVGLSAIMYEYGEIGGI